MKATPTMLRVLEALADGEWRSATAICAALGMDEDETHTRRGGTARAALALVQRGGLDVRIGDGFSAFRLGTGSIRNEKRPRKSAAPRQPRLF